MGDSVFCRCRLPVLFVDVNAVPSTVVYGAGIKVSDLPVLAVRAVRWPGMNNFHTQLKEELHISASPW